MCLEIDLVTVVQDHGVGSDQVDCQACRCTWKAGKQRCQSAGELKTSVCALHSSHRMFPSILQWLYSRISTWSSRLLCIPIICENITTREPCTRSFFTNMSRITVFPELAAILSPVLLLLWPSSVPSNRYGWFHTLNTCMLMLCSTHTQIIQVVLEQSSCQNQLVLTHRNLHIMQENTESSFLMRCASSITTCFHLSICNTPPSRLYTLCDIITTSHSLPGNRSLADSQSFLLASHLHHHTHAGG